jgi:hypothetical protein
VVATVDGCVLLYSDVINQAFRNLNVLPMLQGRQEMATGIEVMNNSDIIVGLYSRYLVRYQPDGSNMKIAEIMKFDSAILAVEKGDIYGIGNEVIVVVTANSVHVIGSSIPINK